MLRLKLGQALSQQFLPIDSTISLDSALVPPFLRRGKVLSSRRDALVLQHSGSPLPDMSSPIRVVKALAELDLLPAEDIALFHDLRGLRNQATHAPEFNPALDAVSRYLQLAAGLERRLTQYAGIES